MKLDIRPYQGVSDLESGLSTAAVATILGSSESQQVQRNGELREYRRQSGLQTVYKDDRLANPGFSRNIHELQFNGVRLFEVSEEQALAALRKSGAKAHGILGFLVFLDLGITMNGFHDGASDQLAATVFERGRWDRHKPRMKPYRF